MCFFRHWRERLAKSVSFAFSVRNGRANQLIPREYIPERAHPSDFGFLISNRDHPAEDLPLWRHDRLVIQDPFLVTHNHTASLSPVAFANLEQQVFRTASRLHAGFPLVSVYGQYAATPGSEAEAKILADPKGYTAALGLLEPGRVPPQLLRENEPVMDDSSELRTPVHRDRWNNREFSKEYVPSREDSSEMRTPVHRTWSKNSRRWLHASSVAPAKQNPAKNVPMTPPKPISLEGRGRKLAEDQEGWGLNSPVHKPSFWRPAHVREPLTLPTNSGSSGPLHATPVTGTGTTNSVPLARETRAGIAYKNVLPKPKGFHTTAYCAARRVPELPKVIGRALDPTVLQSRRQTLFMVQDALQKAFGTDYRVELFGSTRYGISSAKSDLDMVLLDPHHPYGAAPGYEWDVQQTPVYNLRTVAKILKKAGFFIFETLPQASVPIIKFMDNRTGHRVDLNINDRLGVLNSDLIKRYCELNPVLVPMIQYVKLWAKPLGLNSPSRNQLNKPMTFSSYALVMMTIGFLQHRGLLPNLQEDLPPLEPGKLKGTFWLHKPKILCCDVRYNMAEDWTPPEDIPVEQLMQDWFNFWGHSFKFEDEMISIREGGRIPRPPRVSGGTPFNGLFWNIDPFIRTKVMKSPLEMTRP
ncbi:hypothetical protein B0H14DRAFT_783785 [Mycena olivaceomarginata]|nr:hypothetical protein B0H14DRAFT_783785 [Mycena olivaceomarginata]